MTRLAKYCLGNGWAGSWEDIQTPSKVVQLYNLKNDPSESKNLEETNPEKIEELITAIAKAMHDGRTTLGQRQTNEGWPYRHQPTMEKYPQLKER